MLFASGQAASAAVFQCLVPGDAVLAPRNMYWALRGWLVNFAAPRGLRVAFYENESVDDLARAAAQAKPRLVWAETPANPTWEVTDIAAAADIARRCGALLAVDSTSATPMLQRPIELGAHLVMHSATKYLNGHSDVVAGALVTAADDDFWRLLRTARVGRWRGARAIRSVAPPAGHAHARAARGGGERERDGDRHSARGPPAALARPLPRAREPFGTFRGGRARCTAASAACSPCGSRRARPRRASQPTGFGSSSRPPRSAPSKASPSTARASRGPRRCVRRISCAFPSASKARTTLLGDLLEALR